jgi:hypothetical protein
MGLEGSELREVGEGTLADGKRMRAGANELREIGDGMGLGGDEMGEVRFEMVIASGALVPRQNRMNGIFGINGIGDERAKL